MYFNFSALLLLLDLSSYVSAQSTVNTKSACRTILGRSSINPIPSTTVTTTKTTATVTKRTTSTPVSTVTAKPKTTTVITTTTFTATSTLSTATATATTTTTVFTTTGTVQTITATNTVLTTSTVTNTDTTTTVPTPAGFTPVMSAGGYNPKIKGRNILPRAVASSSLVQFRVNAAQQVVASPTQYPKAVSCTVTLLPSTTTTLTSTATTTRTTTVPGVTSTKSVVRSTTTTSISTPPGVTITSTATVTSTVDGSGTTTTTMDQTITATETVVQPGPTFYAACASDSGNFADHANGGYTITGAGISGNNYQVPANNAYDCCANCQATNCKVALYLAAGYPNGVCYNSYVDQCTPGQVTDYYYTYSNQDSGYTLSNGVCGIYQDQGNYPN